MNKEFQEIKLLKRDLEGLMVMFWGFFTKPELGPFATVETLT